MRISQSLRRAYRVKEKWLDNLIGSFAAALTFLMTIIIFIDVIGRYFFGVSRGQIQEYAVFFFVWVVFIMAGVALKEKRHIYIGLLPDSLAKRGRLRAKAALEIYWSITVVALAVSFLYFGMVATSAVGASGMRSTLPHVPPYWLKFVALPVGMGFLFYYSVRELVQNIRNYSQLKRGGEIRPG